MKYNLEKMMVRERRELDANGMKAYGKHYSSLFVKYGYVRDSVNFKAHDAIASYCAKLCGWKKGECDRPDKGLFLYGNVGTGKTMAMKIMSGIFGIEMISVWDMVKEFSLHDAAGLWDMVNEFRAQPLIIDDVANEDNVRMFGNKFPMAAIIAKRHSDGALTFFTSNATGEGIAKTYGKYIFSRICEMCEVIEIKGSDRRRK